jgi:tRNA modification GTPase
MNTIYALATARGKSGVAIVRVSGARAFDAAERLTGFAPKHRMTSLQSVYDSNGGLLDKALVLAFEKGASFTGEKTIEFQIHGGIATIDAVLSALSQTGFTRLAQPGEFTRRALENGCLDLAQIEGLSDLIEAETEAQRKQAIRVFSGSLGEKSNRWRTRLIRATALLEATIDFADEDVPVDVMPEVSQLIDEVQTELEREATGSRAAEQIRNGFEVAIVGAPNVGKSSLLNRLAGRDAAITSDIAGTTRDVIEVRMDLAGLPVTILDTAGLRDTDDIIESKGIERAVERAENADLRVFLYDDQPGFFTLIRGQDDLVIKTKSDISGKADGSISSKTGEGIQGLIDTITGILERKASGASSIIRQRHRQAIADATTYLESARQEIDPALDRSEFAAENLHSAIRALDSLVGRVDVEHILDEIFSSFCLGK